MLSAKCVQDVAVLAETVAENPDIDVHSALCRIAQRHRESAYTVNTEYLVQLKEQQELSINRHGKGDV